LRYVNRRIFEVKKTSAIDNSSKDFCVSKDFFNIAIKNKKDFRINATKDFEILKNFRKTIYLDREIDTEKNCFKNKTIANFYLANIKATTLAFLVVVEF